MGGRSHTHILTYLNLRNVKCTLFSTPLYHLHVLEEHKCFYNQKRNNKAFSVWEEKVNKNEQRDSEASRV